MRKIVAFSGKKGNGKTVSAKYLERYYGFKRISFADPLRVLAKQLCGFTDDDLANPKKKDAPYKDFEWSPREFMLNLGAFLRYHDPDYFVKRLEQEVRTSDSSLIAIDDLRFPNEVKLLKKMDAKIIRLNRYLKDNPYKTGFDDESEIGLDSYKEFDFVVHEFENKTLRTLTDRLDIFLDDSGFEVIE